METPETLEANYRICDDNVHLYTINSQVAEQETQRVQVRNGRLYIQQEWEVLLPRPQVEQDRVVEVKTFSLWDRVMQRLRGKNSG
jgi:hypothetical protein